MDFSTRNNLITEEEVEKFEYLIGEKLPKDYRDFLLKFNGGQPKYYIFDDSLELYPLSLGYLFGLKAIMQTDDLEWNYDIYNGRIMKSFIPIADDVGGNIFCLGISGIFRDKIFIWNHNNEIAEKKFVDDILPENMYPLANNFNIFINQLKEDLEK